MTIYKLTLKYSSFLFTNDVALVKNVEQSVDVDKLTAKDISIINAYISSGAIISDKGKIAVEDDVLAEAVVEAPSPVEVKEEKVEVVKEEVKVEKQIATSILDGEDEPKKKAAPTKKSTTKKA
jgi:ribosomal protein L21